MAKSWAAADDAGRVDNAVPLGIQARSENKVIEIPVQQKEGVSLLLSLAAA